MSRAFLSRSERRILLALASTVIPERGRLPGFDDAALARFERLIGRAGVGGERAVRLLLWAIEGRALRHTGHRFSQLSPDRRQRLLARWQQKTVGHHALRFVLMSVKAAWASSPDFHAALGCRYQLQQPDEPAPWMAQVSPAAEFADIDEALECDVVVVGTGAGGAAVADALAQRGLAVVMLEEGQYFTRADFNGRPLELLDKLYRDRSLTVSLGNAVIPIPIGKTVGGTTTINSGTCFRVPGSVLRSWQDRGLHALSEDALAPYFEQVEQALGVAPAEARYVGATGSVIARGCEALGWSHGPLQRNAPGCDGQGLCCFGCPTDAKRSTNVSYVPSALQANAFLFTGAKVQQVWVEGGRAVGVRGVATKPDGSEVELVVRAGAVVLACGALHTPALLLKQGLANASGQLGRNLSIHPATHAFGRFDELIDSWNSIPQGYCIDEFASEGLMFEGATAPLEVLTGTLGLEGRAFVDFSEQLRHVAMFGFMIKDSSRGRVVLDRNGRPWPLYWVNRKDTALLRRGMGLLARVFLAAGAKEVLPGMGRWGSIHHLDDVARLEQSKVGPSAFDLSAYHPLGTARMGVDPAHSVVGPDHQCHDLPGLFLCDGSAVPSSLGVNPQITIMAMARRAAGFVADSVEG